MKGLFKTGFGDGHMKPMETPLPKPGPGQLLVEVKAASICVPDLHILHADVKLPMKPPVIIGHEFSGVVAELGKGVEDWKNGVGVMAEPSASICGTCHYCRTGSYNLCQERKILSSGPTGLSPSTHSFLPSVSTGFRKTSTSSKVH